MRKILIESNATDYCLTVHFLDKDGGTVKKFQFYNFVGNGDFAMAAINEWITYGISPIQTKGLIEIVG